MNKILYFHGKQAVIDILNYRRIKSNKVDKNLEELIKSFEIKTIPIMQINADLLMCLEIHMNYKKILAAGFSTLSFVYSFLIIYLHI